MLLADSRTAMEIISLQKTLWWFDSYLDLLWSFCNTYKYRIITLLSWNYNVPCQLYFNWEKRKKSTHTKLYFCIFPHSIQELLDIGLTERAIPKFIVKLCLMFISFTRMGSSWGKVQCLLLICVSSDLGSAST